VHVQQDQIEVSSQENDQRFGAVLRRLGLVRVLVAELPEEVLENLDYRGLVVDDQDSLGHLDQYMTPSTKFTIHRGRREGVSELPVSQAVRRWHRTCTSTLGTVSRRSLAKADK